MRGCNVFEHIHYYIFNSRDMTSKPHTNIISLYFDYKVLFITGCRGRPRGAHWLATGAEHGQHPVVRR